MTNTASHMNETLIIAESLLLTQRMAATSDVATIATDTRFSRANGYALPEAKPTAYDILTDALVALLDGLAPGYGAELHDLCTDNGEGIYYNLRLLDARRASDLGL